jgi:putative transposase
MSAPFAAFRYRRRTIRLPGYDYSRSGGYFVTICTHNRDYLFGEIKNGEMRLHEFGEIVAMEWAQTPSIRPRIALDVFCVMPNHFHGIIVIKNELCDMGVFSCRGTLQRAPTVQFPPKMEHFGKPTSDTIPTIVRLFKSSTTKRINTKRETSGSPVWQRNYYEHVIRDDDELNRIREYVGANPANWDRDEENPERIIS